MERPAWRPIWALIFSAFVGMSAFADAAVIRVDPTNGDDANDGSAWTADGAGAGPKQTIAGALAAVGPVDGERDHIWLKRGVYQPDAVGPLGGALEMVSELAIRGGFSGTEESAEERPPLDPRETVIDGSVADGGAPARSVIVYDNLTDTLLEGVHVTGGLIPLDADGEDGAGILMENSAGTHVIRDTWITDNRNLDDSGNGGGGIAISSSDLEMQRCFVAGNETPVRFGGGVMLRNSNVMIRDSVFTGNVGNRGGGISIRSLSTVVIDRCIFAGNIGNSYSGGIYSDVNEGSDVRISNTLIVGNESTFGAGVNVDFDGRFVITNCTVAENDGRTGDGISILGFGTPTPSDAVIRNTLLANHPASHLTEDTDDVDFVELSNLLFYESPLLLQRRPESDVSDIADLNALIDVLTADNIVADPMFAHGPGGQWEAKTAEAGNLLTLTDNAPDPAPFVPGALRGSLIRPDLDDELVFYIVDNTASEITIFAAPGIADEIGETAMYEFRDYRLVPGSPAINAGADFTSDAPETAIGLEGTRRPSGGGFDIGAYEFTTARGDLLMAQ